MFTLGFVKLEIDFDAVGATACWQERQSFERGLLMLVSRMRQMMSFARVMESFLMRKPLPVVVR